MVFEKGRGVGGRMASRYAGPFTFDHGAQYLTVHDPEFAGILKPLLAAGAVAPWAGSIARIDPAVVTSLAKPRELILAASWLQSCGNPPTSIRIRLPMSQPIAGPLPAGYRNRTAAPMSIRRGGSPLQAIGLGAVAWRTPCSTLLI